MPESAAVSARFASLDPWDMDGGHAGRSTPINSRWRCVRRCHVSNQETDPAALLVVVPICRSAFASRRPFEMEYRLRAVTGVTSQAGGRMPLGPFGDSPGETHTTTLGEGDVAVFSTDGLVERPDEDIERGFERLRRAVEPADTDADTLAARVVEVCLGDRERRDDACVVTVRRHAP